MNKLNLRGEFKNNINEFYAGLQNIPQLFAIKIKNRLSYFSKEVTNL